MNLNENKKYSKNTTIQKNYQIAFRKLKQHIFDEIKRTTMNTKKTHNTICKLQVSIIKDCIK